MKKEKLMDKPMKMLDEQDIDGLFSEFTNYLQLIESRLPKASNKTLSKQKRTQVVNSIRPLLPQLEYILKLIDKLE